MIERVFLQKRMDKAVAPGGGGVEPGREVHFFTDFFFFICVCFAVFYGEAAES